MSKLARCPFCGGKPTLELFNDGFFDYARISCCHLTFDWCDDTAGEAAIAAWNRRADHIRDTTKMVSNADRIRGMTDEELARWLVDATVCERVCDEDEYCHGNECVERVTRWLKQPAKEEHNETDRR